MRAAGCGGCILFAVLLADDFIIGKNGSFTKAMVDAYMATGKSTLCVDRVTIDQINKYGIIDPGPSTDAAAIGVRGIAESLILDVAPSQLASTDAIFWMGRGFFRL